MNPVCPYCRTEIGTDEGERLDCPGCGTPHHPECFAENGGCTVFGCAKAPVDEAKISVSGSELNRAAPASNAPLSSPVGTTASPSSTPLRRPSVLRAGGFTILELSDAANPAAAQMAYPQAPAAPGVTGTPPPPPHAVAGTGVAPPPMPSPRGVYAPLQPQDLFPAARPSKNRVVFVLLGIFLGIFGAHNFYAGYIKKAVVQLCLTVLTVFYGAIVSWIWAIVEVCVVNRDAYGTEFT